MTRLPAARVACVLELLYIMTAFAQGTSEDEAVLHSLRRALRDKDTALRSTRRADAPDYGRKLQAGSDEPHLCGEGDCRVELTTGIAGWSGAARTRSDPTWAQVTHGSWIGNADADAAPHLLVASVSFNVAEPGCASLDVSFAADRKLRSAQLNGHGLSVPPHSHRATTAQAGRSGLTVLRGRGLFSLGTNRLVLTVSNDAGALGLYVSGSVQLLCPLDEAKITMHPTQGPATGGTLVEVRSNTHVYVERWIRCTFGRTSVSGTVVDASTVRCSTPSLASASPQGWVGVELVTSHQGHAMVGVHYKGVLSILRFGHALRILTVSNQP